MPDASRDLQITTSRVNDEPWLNNLTASENTQRARNIQTFVNKQYIKRVLEN